jgi:hypothetical protein
MKSAAPRVLRRSVAGIFALLALTAPAALAEPPTRINLLIRGQSNAAYFAYFGGMRALREDLLRLLGFTPPAQDIALLGGAEKTMWSGVGLLRRHDLPNRSAWLIPTQAPPYWQDDEKQSAFTAYLNGLPAAVKSTPTVTIWLHNENDSYYLPLTQAGWENAIRYTIGAQRKTLGQAAATTPVDFVFVPFDTEPPTLVAWFLAPGVARMQAGFEHLAADPDFHAIVAARMGDADMNFTSPYYGGSHMSRDDAARLAQRLAPAIANQLWRYATPGAPAALAHGALPATGPSATAATRLDARHLRVAVVLDSPQATLQKLSPAAAQGAGWFAVAGYTAVVAAAATLSDTALSLAFAQDLPPGARLYYGWGTGRIALPGQPGEGAAIYDRNGLPMFAPADGIPIR